MMSKLEAAKTLFLRNLDRLEGAELKEFCDWAQDVLDESQYGSREHAHGGCHEDADPALDSIQAIIAELREQLPLNAMAPGEEMHIPPSDKEEGYTEDNTVHVDSFLYDDEIVDELCDAGKMTRAYCNDCGSRNTSYLNFVSHSMSVAQLQFIFKAGLPDLSGKHLVDVGSRLGAVLYGGHLFSKAAKLTGIELSKYFSDISKETLAAHNMLDRCHVVNDDVMNQAELLSSADVVVLNNVFEYFFEHEQQAAYWTFLRKAISKSGSYIVAVPALEESLEKAKVNMNLRQWVTKVKVDRSEFSDDPDNDIHHVHIYYVK